MPGISEKLAFYFITDDKTEDFSAGDQVRTALEAGATLVQYRCKRFQATEIPAVESIRDICRRHDVPFIINDDVLLAKAVAADGVHLGQTDTPPAAARRVLGPGAVLGVSVSTPEELAATDLTVCDYIGTGPVFVTSTKADAKPVIGPTGLQLVTQKAPLPVVAIGGVTAENVSECMERGAAGGAVISAITRASEPKRAARAFAKACGLSPRRLLRGWEEEFGLIRSFLKDMPAGGPLRVGPGDDAALLAPLANPVITTDTQREDVHFRRAWQSMEEIGEKAVEVTLSDLAACYARPQAFFVNLGLPQYIAEKSVRDLYAGIRKALARHGAVLGGGNVSAAASLCLDLSAIGEGREGVFPSRQNAKPGDGVYVTGALGLARAGLMCLQRGDGSFPALVHRFKRPVARFDASRVLADHGVACAMDISDGLSGDALHIARASGLTIAFAPEGFSIDRELADFASRYGLSATELMVSGGEDYELLFTCPHEVFRQLRRALPDAFRVGGCIGFQGRHLENLPVGASSHQHGMR